LARGQNSIVIRNGRVIDPASGLDRDCDIRIENGVIAAIGGDVSSGTGKVIEAAGLVVAPGLVDLHAHLREPGFELKETIASGTLAAAAGGFTCVCCMPNTSPAIDSVKTINDMLMRIERDASVKVLPIAAISKGRAGIEPVDYDALAEAGAIGFSDDGESCDDSLIMAEALDASARIGRPVMVHCEDKSLAGGDMHEGVTSERLGLRALPASAEEITLARDIELVRLFGGWLHVLHVSTGKGAEMVDAAKRTGVRITAEVMPHHLLMTDEWVAGNRSFVNVDEPAGSATMPADPNAKVNPPLRSRLDCRLLLASLKAGVFDVVATDHAPHARIDKVPGRFDEAAFGMSGFEFALPLMLTLVRAGHLTLPDLVCRMSWNPAELLRLPTGRLSPGRPADVVIFDPNEAWTVDEGQLKTKSANTPLLGMTLRGRVKATIVDGEIRFAA
jgi:dihydroorotase